MPTPSPMRFCLVALLLAVFAGCVGTSMNTGDGLTVRITLEPGQRFVMGDGVHAAVRVTVRNAGETPVDLATVAGGEETMLGTVQPEETEAVELPPDVALYVVNRSRSEASVRAEVRGDTRLSLRYETAD